MAVATQTLENFIGGTWVPATTDRTPGLSDGVRKLACWEDDLFCPGLIAGHRTESRRELELFCTAREHSSHAPHVVLIAQGYKLAPVQDGPSL